MTAPGSGAINRAVAGDDRESAPRRISTVNPVTGLSTDYLNHFAEAIMVLEMAAVMPDCLEDLRAWQPKTYCEHFAVSHFADRDALIAAYEAADPELREALDRATETLNAVLAETRNVVIQHIASPHSEALAQRAVAWLKPLVARTAAIINGTATGARAKGAQAAVDALFDR